MSNQNKQLDIFGDSFQIFLSYISRKIKSNPDYKPFTLIRAFECAMQAVEGVEVGACALGTSMDGTEDAIHNPYIVVLQKLQDGIEVKEIRNIKVDKQVPIEIMILMFRMQIHVDKIPGDTLKPKQMVDVFNEVIPGEPFFAMGERWQEFRDEFKRRLEAGKMSFPQNFPERVFLEVETLTYETPWEDYSPDLRSLIGTSVCDFLEKPGNVVVITTPKDFDIQKYKVFDTAMEFLLGRASEYLDLLNQDKKKLG